MNRREFLETLTAAVVVPSIARQAAPTNEWGSPVFDLHFHARQQPAANITHLDGAGVTKANLLTRGAGLDQVKEQVKAIQDAAPGRFTWFNSYDVSKPDAEQVLTAAVKAGAQGFGEMKFHVAADGPELRRMYALAADLGEGNPPRPEPDGSFGEAKILGKNGRLHADETSQSCEHAVNGVRHTRAD